MRSLAFCILIIAFSFLAEGQSTAVGTQSNDILTRLKQKEMTGSFSIEMDSLILENYNKHLVQNSKSTGVKGYRIRIFSDNGIGAKEEQKKVRARMLSFYPDLATYNRYEGSYYKIYVGDFRTRRDALKTLEDIKRRFPDAFIVEDNILIGE